MSAEPRLGVGAAIVQNSQILLIRRVKAPEAGHWALPGGKVDLFESCENSLIRECEEELGIKIKEPFLLTIMNMWNEELGYHWVAPIYLVNEFDGVPKLMEPDKHTQFGWFPIENLPTPCAQAVMDAVSALIEK